MQQGKSEEYLYIAQSLATTGASGNKTVVEMVKRDRHGQERDFGAGGRSLTPQVDGDYEYDSDGRAARRREEEQEDQEEEERRQRNLDRRRALRTDLLRMANPMLRAQGFGSSNGASSSVRSGAPAAPTNNDLPTPPAGDDCDMNTAPPFQLHKSMLKLRFQGGGQPAIVEGREDVASSAKENTEEEEEESSLVEEIQTHKDFRKNFGYDPFDEKDLL